MIRPALAALAFLALTLPLPIAPAPRLCHCTSSGGGEDREQRVHLGISRGAAFGVAILYAVCKPANRHALHVQ